LALFGPKRGVRLELEAERDVVLGRSSEADVQLVDGKVSRLHCRFSLRGDSLTVEDLGSHNGTYVGGARLDGPRALRAGDEIAVGDSLFVVDGDGDLAAARWGDETLAVTPATAAGQPPAVAAAGDAPLAAVTALSAALRAASGQEAAARAALAAIESALAPRRAFVLLWDAARGLARPLVGRSDGATVSVSRTVLDLAARRGAAVAIEDAVEDRDLGQARSVVRNQLRAVVVAPLLDAAGAVVGFLHADRAQPAYGPADAAIMDAFAGVVSLHLARAAGAATARPAARPPSRAAGPGEPAPDAPAPPAGTSASWRATLRTAEAVAPAPTTVLITGETGTGKEEIARYIHRRSARAAGPFVAVNCGAIPEGIAESELFGHERGAFTGASGARAGHIEAADGGTLFLDEVGELSAAMQARLLRVLQERSFSRVGSTVCRRVDLRLVTATHRDLEAAMRQGRFREDLYYRLAVVRIPLAPLRDRADDLQPLADALLARVAARLGRRPPTLEDAALRVLARWPWPGNVRELANALERALVLRAPGADGPLAAEEVHVALGEPPPAAPGTPGLGTLANKIAALERVEIEAALRRARGVKSRAAQLLGLSRPTLDKKIADLEIDLWRQDDTTSRTS
jgi:transcriptional regulator with GAF, ATPase, and Fis domain